MLRSPLASNITLSPVRSMNSVCSSAFSGSLLSSPGYCPSPNVSLQLPTLDKRSRSVSLLRTTVKRDPDPLFMNAIGVKTRSKSVTKQVTSRYLQPIRKQPEGQPGFYTLDSSVQHPHVKSIMSRVGRPALKVQSIGPASYDSAAAEKCLNKHTSTNILYKEPRFKDMTEIEEENKKRRQLGQKVNENIGPADYTYDAGVLSTIKQPPDIRISNTDRFPKSKLQTDVYTEDFSPRDDALERYFAAEAAPDISVSPRFAGDY